ncbi:META domain-containing protein [Pedobacter sp. LMG 31464]|uniref:META domain-containing protein n=1 Tax=Pedobacter planticolens TaxID=2679964 RepID=A0A923DZQ4_9SPHI|nr:META domain-containing protein [Pedobacter planticolens]MBB2146065.1 META domain-containing protein [Pedobacter planticolens]
MKRIFLGFILVIAMQACSEKLGMNNVANSKWVLSEWPGQIMPNTTKKATLNFDTDNKVSGKSFCNGFGGMVTIDGDKIKFSELIGTMMYCEDVGQAEGKYTEGLRTANSFKIVSGKLQLLKDGQLAMVFTKTE